MPKFVEKYINPFTDFGFKKLFGEEPNKNLLLDFLNELLREEQGQITQLTYLKNEHLGQELDRKAIFDLYCTNEHGERFIVEPQKTKQNFFKDRTVYYATFPIREQAKRPDWNYELNAVYTVAILDFVFDEGKNEPEKYRYDVKLTDQETCKVFYDKLTFIYLEMPKFGKTLDELETRFDKWLYILRHLNRLDRIPEKLRERIFDQLFEAAEIAKFNTEQLNNYEDSLKYYRDLKNSLDTAREEGEQKGREEGRKEGMKKGRKEGMEKGRKEGMEEGIEKGRKEGMEKGLEQGIGKGMEKGMEKGREEGRREGIEKGLEQVAINGIKQGKRDEVIMEMTGLSVEQLNGLKQKIHEGQR